MTWPVPGKRLGACHLSGNLRAAPEGAASWEAGNGRKELTWGKTSLSTVTESHATGILKTESLQIGPSGPKRYSGQACLWSPGTFLLRHLLVPGMQGRYHLLRQQALTNGSLTLKAALLAPLHSACLSDALRLNATLRESPLFKSTLWPQSPASGIILKTTTN